MNNNNSLSRRKGNESPDIKRHDELNPKSHLRHNYKPDCLRYGVRSVNISPDKKFLVVTWESNNGYIRVIDLEKLELLPHRYIGHTDSVRMVSFTKNSKYFISASW